jgi:tetratricopeptide (TPR) repeat protein
MYYKYTIPTLFILTSITLNQPTTAKDLSCSSKIDKISQKITVLIDINNKDNGSGILIKQEGNTYTVLTAFHNVKNPSLKYTIITPDQQRYPIQNQNIQPLGTGIDLAVVKFVSSKTYQVAKFGNSDLIKRGDNVYVAGFRLSTPSIPAPLYDCFDGQVSAHATQVTIDGGYNLVYTNPTLKGMSGGPVLNSEGELIGIHGRGDEYDNRERDRFAGIPINIYVRIAAGVTDKPSIRGLTANDYFELGFKKYEQKDYREAIVAYTEAIILNPNYSYAYYNRGIVRDELGDKQGAIDDYTQAIKINPNLAQAYSNRGYVRNELGDKQGAIADYTQAIKINPNYADAYYNRGIVRKESGDKQRAIDDYNLAIKINPNLAQAYNNRGNVRDDLGDKQGAIDDYNLAIKFNPNLAQAYNNRGVVRKELGDKQGAIDDYNLAIKFNPEYADAYTNRGIIYHQQENYTAAISDYNQAVAKNANSLVAINNIGLIKYEQGDKKTAIKQWQQAMKINNQLAEPILALAVALYTKGEKEQAYQLATTALKLDKNFADVNVLKKNVWGDKIIADTQKLLSTLPRKLQQ